MKNTILLLRISYWWGIIADAIMAVLMLFPDLFLRVMNINPASTVGIRYGLLYGAPLMIGWTLLLVWADRKPLDRKGILPLTLLVVVGYILVQMYTMFTGLAPIESMLPLFVSQAAMSSLFIFSYLKAKNPSPALQKG